MLYACLSVFVRVCVCCVCFQLNCPTERLCFLSKFHSCPSAPPAPTLSRCCVKSDSLVTPHLHHSNTPPPPFPPTHTALNRLLTPLPYPLQLHHPPKTPPLLPFFSTPPPHSKRLPSPQHHTFSLCSFTIPHLHPRTTTITYFSTLLSPSSLQLCPTPTTLPTFH